MSSLSDRWLVRFQPNPRARLRLLCFPYAGNGSTAYRLWPQALPPDLEVCAVVPPGREARWREPAFVEIPRLVTALAEALEPELDRPFAFFGHSMGAVVGFELARHLQATRGVAPEVLFVSARAAPHLPALDPPLSKLSDGRFLEAVTSRFGGIPRVVLDDADLMAMFVRVLRADLSALESYSYVTGPKLRCPVVAYGGETDRLSPEQISGWGELTERSFSWRMFRGDHFFLNSMREELLADVARALQALSAGEARRAVAPGGVSPSTAKP